jgi:hypothetical protein|tara:strand:- start:2141 stop:2458 length:318 start_codon:yes stop_codon:yes gene_type:complete
MDTNTISSNTVNTNTVAVTEVKAVKSVKAGVTKTPGKLGRKPTVVSEITGKDFIIADLEKANANVKSPTIRAFVARNVASGRYVVVATQKTGGRGKPANIYRVKA